MTELERLDMYKIGVEVGIISIDEFTDFIFAEIEKTEDVPYIYLDLVDAVSGGVNMISACIEDHLSRQGYVHDPKYYSMINRILVGRIKKLYGSGEISIKSAAYYMVELSQHDWYMTDIYEDILLAEKENGRVSDSIRKELNDVLAIGIETDEL